MTGRDKGFRAKVIELVRKPCKCDGCETESEDLADRIMSLVRELIPTDDGTVGKSDDFSDGWLGGYEACRTEILSQLEEGK